MGVRAISRGRPRGADLGVRVDGPVAGKVANDRGVRHLRVVAQPRVIDVRPAETWIRKPPAAPLQQAKPQRSSQRKEALRVGAGSGAASCASSARRIRVEPSARRESDPMFDIAVEEAQKLTTVVRPGSPTVLAGGTAAKAAARDEDRSAPKRTGRRAYRFTLRGQRALVAAGFVLSIGLGALVGTIMGSDPVPQETTTLVVQSGDTLWSIAKGLAGAQGDPRPVVSEISSLNGLQTALIAPGQSLVVPAD